MDFVSDRQTLAQRNQQLAKQLAKDGRNQRVYSFQSFTQVGKLQPSFTFLGPSRYKSLKKPQSARYPRQPAGLIG